LHDETWRLYAFLLLILIIVDLHNEIYSQAHERHQNGIKQKHYDPHTMFRHFSRWISSHH